MNDGLLALTIGFSLVAGFSCFIFCCMRRQEKKWSQKSQYTNCPVLNENAAKVITVDMTVV